MHERTETFLDLLDDEGQKGQKGQKRVSAETMILNREWDGRPTFGPGEAATPRRVDTSRLLPNAVSL